MASNSCSCHGFPKSWGRPILGSISGVAQTVSLKSTPSALNGISHSASPLTLRAREKQALASSRVVLPCGTAPAKPWLLTSILHSPQKTGHAQLTVTNQSFHPNSGLQSLQEAAFRNQKGEAPGVPLSPPARLWAASFQLLSISYITILEGRQNPSFSSTQATELRAVEPFVQCHTEAGLLI